MVDQQRLNKAADALERELREITTVRVWEREKMLAVAGRIIRAGGDDARDA
jgi:hypothetical protein